MRLPLDTTCSARSRETYGSMIGSLMREKKEAFVETSDLDRSAGREPWTSAQSGLCPIPIRVRRTQELSASQGNALRG
jgi:hypothetical protein